MSNQLPNAHNRSVQGIEKFVTWLALFVLTLLYWGYVWVFERIDYLAVPPGWWQWLIERFPLFDVIKPFVLVPAEFFSLSVLRNFIPVLVAAWLARRAVRDFLSTFYDLPGEQEAQALLNRLRSWSVPNKPSFKIDGDDIVAGGRDDSLFKVGGPARVIIDRGSAIITEINGHFARVLAPGARFLGRFEYPYQSVDLRPQDRQTDDAKMMTKDGIEITASVGVTFRIASKDQSPSHEVPFPFDEASARRAAYAQMITGDGKAADWRSASLGAATSALATIVAESRLDELAHPMQGGVQPYPSRNRQMRRATRARMAKQGVAVSDTRLGRLELPDAVLDEYLEYWRVYREKKRRLEEVEGQAVLLEEAEIARVRASALMFQAILEGLQRARQTDPDASSRSVVAVRLIETLQAMALRSQDVSRVPDKLLVSLGSLRQQLLENGQIEGTSEDPAIS